MTPQQQVTIQDLENNPGGYLDKLVSNNTMFDTMLEMLNVRGGYRPSIFVFSDELKLIADEYDRLQASRGDKRRVDRRTR